MHVLPRNYQSFPKCIMLLLFIIMYFLFMEELVRTVLPYTGSINCCAAFDMVSCGGCSCMLLLSPVQLPSQLVLNFDFPPLQLALNWLLNLRGPDHYTFGHWWWLSLAASCTGGIFPLAIGANTPPACVVIYVILCIDLCCVGGGLLLPTLVQVLYLHSSNLHCGGGVQWYIMHAHIVT